MGQCDVFDLYSGNPYDGDFVTAAWMQHGGSDCPVGAALMPGDALSWTSDGDGQGSVGSPDGDNDCAAKGTCGLPYNPRELGGGWQLCFA